ncbi:excitatory amino acid transporter 1 isoform X2 [Sitodiplosis mosellana]|nr:excitatory amino acid transporter 1 isoform X2 [Sitodiplosis mosellana]XP_055302996.1 excitatory amino acid transporter 1 isoform X2 [Sitodiplosis mosellana]
MPVNSRGFIKRNLLTILTCVGVLSGVLVGLITKNSSSEPWTKRQIMYIQYPGDLFLRMLKCLIVPLLVSSITCAIGSLDLSMSGKIAKRAITYYLTTTISAVILGIILVTTIRPGVIGGDNNFATNTTSKSDSKKVYTVDTLLDLIRNVFPPNIIEATIAQSSTELSPPNGNTSLPLYLWNFKQVNSTTTNVLGIVMFSVVLGTALGKLGSAGKPLLDFLVATSEAMMIITHWVIWLSPLGVFFLVVAKIIEMDSLAIIVGKLGAYFITVMLGLFIHGFGTIAVIFFVCTRKMPYGYISQMGQMLATAFGTGSSSATMPVTIDTLDNMNIDPRVTRFVIPVGATVNMDGTALYEAVAAIFIAQLRNVELSFGKLVAVSVTATAASIGAAGIPSAGLVTMVMVLDTVGLPSEDISLIVAVDWILDRFRTTINVMCDTLGAILVDHLSRHDLKDKPCPELGEPHELMELKPANNEKE